MLLGLFVLASVVFWLWALFDLLTAPSDQVRLLPKLVWLLVIVVFLQFGALAWLWLGRPSGTRRGPDPGSFGKRKSGPRVPVGPDDDPDFLRRL